MARRSQGHYRPSPWNTASSPTLPFWRCVFASRHERESPFLLEFSPSLRARSRRAASRRRLRVGRRSCRFGGCLWSLSLENRPKKVERGARGASRLFPNEGIRFAIFQSRRRGGARRPLRRIRPAGELGCMHRQRRGGGVLAGLSTWRRGMSTCEDCRRRVLSVARPFCI